MNLSVKSIIAAIFIIAIVALQPVQIRGLSCLSGIWQPVSDEYNGIEFQFPDCKNATHCVAEWKFVADPKNKTFFKKWIPEKRYCIQSTKLPSDYKIGWSNTAAGHNIHICKTKDECNGDDANKVIKNHPKNFTCLGTKSQTNCLENSCKVSYSGATGTSLFTQKSQGCSGKFLNGLEYCELKIINRTDAGEESLFGPKLTTSIDCYCNSEKCNTKDFWFKLPKKIKHSKLIDCPDLGKPHVKAHHCGVFARYDNARDTSLKPAYGKSLLEGGMECFCDKSSCMFPPGWNRGNTKHSIAIGVLIIISTMVLWIFVKVVIL